MEFNRRAVEGAKEMSKKSINTDLKRETVSRKQTVTGSRLTASKKKRVSSDL